MAITPGTRIGAYEVTSQLGEGGMGVVYRARDMKLLRDAALKVLPDHFADDPERLSLLQREAQFLASLNHPNIAQIYGLEQIGNTGCIVMELVEGETLADRLKNGPLPIDEAIEIAKQIAEALAAAHEKGIVHRDLKPANVKLTPKGTVKVLDFGLAKAFGALSPVSKQTEMSTLPTQVSGSMTGRIVGTVGYMSPEQARGKEVDARTDIWAFGCVLYEMLTARLAFHAETATDMIAKIVTADPDLNLLPPTTPAPIRMLLAATLNKNVHQRLQHIGDMKLFLDPKFFPSVADATDKPTAPTKSSRQMPVIALLVVALIAALIPAVLYFRTAAPAAAIPLRLEVALTEGGGAITVSPDGRRFAYPATTDGSRALWVRSVASETAQRIAGTENVTAGPVWSADSQRVAFVAEGKIKSADLSVAGTGVQVICDAPLQVRGLSWNRDGVMLIARGGDNLIVRVSNSGGELKPVTALDTSKKETAHAVPFFLPDGNHFLFAVVSQIPDNSGIFVGSLDGMMKKRVAPLGNRLDGVAYSSGYLLLSTGNLTAQPFDIKNFTLSEKPATIAEGSLTSVSDTGLLVYRKPPAAPAGRQLTWFDRSGKPVGQVGEADNYGDIQVAPKADRVAVDLVTPGSSRDVWVIDVGRGVKSRVTFEPSDDWNPAWSADGSRLIFASGSNSTGTHIYEKASSGAGEQRLVYESKDNEIPVDISPDGRYIPFSRQKNEGGVDLWVLDTMSKTMTPYIQSKFDKAQAKLSPDGKWIAYTTNETGTYQIVIQSFPDPNGGKWQISAQGGIEPKWRHDGRELYYLALDAKLMAVPIKGDRTIEAGTPVPLFETPLTVIRGQLPRTHRYDVAADGRFLLGVPKGNPAPPPVIAVMNWTAGLETK